MTLQTIYISAGNSYDDAWEGYTDAQNFIVTDPYDPEYIGFGGERIVFSSDGGNHGGFRFPNILIPSGSTINNATFNFYSFHPDPSYPGTGNDHYYVDFYGDDSANSPNFESPNDFVYERTRTDATTELIHPSAGAGLQQVDVTAIVQEIINKNSWQSGNALTILGISKKLIDVLKFGWIPSYNFINETSTSFTSAASPSAAFLSIDWEFSPTDLLIFSDFSDTTANIFYTSASDNFIFSDSSRGGTYLSAACIDGLTFSDITSGAYRFPTYHSVSAGINFSDFILETGSANISAADILNLSDSVLASNEISTNAADEFIFSEEASGARRFATDHNASDGIKFTDLVATTHINYTSFTIGSNLWNDYNVSASSKDNHIKSVEQPGGISDINYGYDYFLKTQNYDDSLLIPYSRPLMMIDYFTTLNDLVESDSSRINYVKLWIYVYQTNGEDITFYRLKRNWSELESTWNQATSTQAWQTAGATGPNDYDSTPLGTINVAGTGWFSLDITNYISDTIDGTYENFGWEARGNDYSQWYSKDAGNNEAGNPPPLGLNFRPYLEVYILEPSLDMTVSDGFTISDSSESHWHYVDSISDGITFSEDVSGAYRFPTDHNADDGIIFSEEISGAYRFPTYHSVSAGMIFSEDVSGAYRFPTYHSVSAGFVLNDELIDVFYIFNQDSIILSDSTLVQATMNPESSAGSGTADIAIFSDAASVQATCRPAIEDIFKLGDSDSNTVIFYPSGAGDFGYASDGFEFYDKANTEFYDLVTDIAMFGTSASTTVDWGPSAYDTLMFSEKASGNYSGSKKVFTASDLLLRFVSDKIKKR